jgi:hypothetical protein
MSSTGARGLTSLGTSRNQLDILPLPRPSSTFPNITTNQKQNPKSKNRRYNPLILIALLVLPNPQADWQKLLSSKHYHKSKSKIQNPKSKNRKYSPLDAITAKMHTLLLHAFHLLHAPPRDSTIS